MEYIDPECKSDEEITEWLKHKSIMMQTFNSKMDFNVSHGNPTR